MTYRVLSNLADVVRTSGIPVIEVDGWQSRGRPPSTGGFDPRGVLCHHTASPDSWSDQQDLSCILAGNSSAPGPISQLFLSRYEPWPCYIVAAGRANHGGKGAIPGESCGDMNLALLGIEAGQSGSTRWPDGMTTNYAKLVAALCRGYGWSVGQVYLHFTTGPPCGNSKIDPSGPWQREPGLPLGNPGGSTWNLDVWRQFISEQGGSTPTPPGGDEMAYVIYESVDDAGTRWAWADFLGLEAGGLCESVVWITGDYKAQVEQSGAAVEHKRRAQGGYRTMRLEAGLPQGDQQYAWSAAPGVDFRQVG